MKLETTLKHGLVPATQLRDWMLIAGADEATTVVEVYLVNHGDGTLRERVEDGGVYNIGTGYPNEVRTIVEAAEATMNCLGYSRTHTGFYVRPISHPDFKAGGRFMKDQPA